MKSVPALMGGLVEFHQGIYQSAYKADNAFNYPVIERVESHFHFMLIVAIHWHNVY